MRWTLGNYTLKYNPKSLSKTWSPQNPVGIGVNGLISNSNLLFNGTQSFSIDIYDKPTKAISSSITGSYIGVSEKRVNGNMYLLKTGGAFDVKGKDNTLIGTKTIVSGNGVTLPTGNPISINDWDTGLAFIYPNSSGNQLLITDENGIANRKYIYNSDDSKYIEDIAWDYNANFITLNPYGQIYTINTSTGAKSLIFQFDDYSSNLSGLKKRYTSIFMYQKNSNYYMGVLTDTKDILFIDYVNLNLICKAKTGLNNILSISYSNYSNNSFLLLSNSIRQITFNTCRLDVEQIKSAVSNGQVMVSDEQGFQYMLMIKSLNITRNPSNEEWYGIDIQADIAYDNIGFGNIWIKNSRG
jgi:hypothetical protein